MIQSKLLNRKAPIHSRASHQVKTYGIQKVLSCAVMWLLCTGLALGQITKPKKEYAELLVTASHADRIYHVGEEASIKVEAYAGGNPVDGVWLFYQHGPEMMYGNKMDSVIFRNGVAKVNLGTMHEPGFLAFEWHTVIAGRAYKDLFKVGFDPDSIRTYARMPKDFQKFWHKTLTAAQKVPFDAKVTRLPQYDTEKSEYSLVELTVGPKGKKMFGWLSRPKDGKPHPVIFYPPGAGRKKIVREGVYSDEGFICLKVEIHGFNPMLPDQDYDSLTADIKDYNTKGITDRDSFYYRDVYAGCSRCVDWLTTLPDWDGKNVFVSGGSQGGALTVVTAALNPKVTALACFYPALNDLTGFLHHRAGGWPMYFRKRRSGASPVKDTLRVSDVLQYYDVTNFARMLKCDGFYNFGYSDDTCSPTSIWGMLNVLTAPKKIVVTPSAGHWRFIEVNNESIRWLKSKIKPFDSSAGARHQAG